MVDKAFITGGARGIGAAIAAVLVRDGLDVWAPTRADLDLANIEAVESFLNMNTDYVPDVLVINAGENNPQDLLDVSLENWSHTLDVNLTSAFLILRDFGSRMLKKRRGRIVVVSSVYSIRAREGRAPYSVSKAGLNALVRSAALEFAPAGVLVNGICPGFVLTDMTRQNNDDDDIKRLEGQIPLGRLADPVEVAELVEYLASFRNTYITGQLIAIDGGFLCR